MKLEECTAPIDKNAYRVIRPARKEDVWLPKPKEARHIAHSENFIAVKPVPASCSHMESVVGKRRGRMVVFGYAAVQPERKNKKAAWVVRCDCGNFEHRSSILRWLGTDAPDMCTECRNREFKTRGEFFPREKAKRETLQVPDMQ